MGPHPVPNPGDIRMTFSPRCPLVNFSLHTKFERDRIKNDRVIDQKADERKIRITRIEPVGEPYREVCLSP